MHKEYEPIMRDLIKTVMRSFYEVHHVIIADLLLENLLLSDSDFCEKMKMLGREFNKLIVKLRDDHLVRHDVKVEIKEDGRQILRTVYFFNFAEVRDIIKYKIYMMTKALEVNVRNNEESFYCPGCERRFTALDAQAHMENFVFKCIFCNTDLIENNISRDETRVDLKELLASINTIIILLKKAEAYEIPILDYFQVLEMKKERIEAEKKEKDLEKEPEDNNLKVLDNIANEDEDFDDSDEEIKKLKTEENSIIEYVLVNGIKKKLNEITEADKESMNEEEYLKYFEIYSKYN